MIDTHSHLDDSSFTADLDEVVGRARDAGVSKVFLPAIELPSLQGLLDVCRQYKGFAYPMIGLHPESIDSNYKEVLSKMRGMLDNGMSSTAADRFIAIGEVGLDFYWSREFMEEQLDTFEEQVIWSVETRLPLSIHCRKAQNELVRIMRRYESELPGGVFHCFTGNEHEAEELLSFNNFVLGIGGVLTFKNSHLPEVLPATVPLSRIVLETDSPYMAPVPYRGKRNESAFVVEVAEKLAQCYGVTREEVSRITDENVLRVFGDIG